MTDAWPDTPVFIIQYVGAAAQDRSVQVREYRLTRPKIPPRDRRPIYCISICFEHLQRRHVGKKAKTSNQGPGSILNIQTKQKCVEK